MRFSNFHAFSSLVQRSISSCSTPQSSGNSAKYVLPPKVTTKSDKCPKTGLAEMPEKPSEPPHLRPMLSLESGTGLRSSLLASSNATKVSLIAAESISNSVPYDCCSKNRMGLSNLEELRLLISFIKSVNCVFWQPKLKTVMPVTLAL